MFKDVKNFFFRLRDEAILNILRNRYEDCSIYQGDEAHRCQPLLDMYEEATGAWFSKCESNFFKHLYFLDLN